jgi:PilZ domain.
MTQDCERRTNGRFNKVFSVYISGAWGNAFGIARNISEGGMFIETLDPYPLGSQLSITFSFPGNEMEMTATGEVVHISFMNRSAGGSPRKLLLGMGVHFTGFVPLPEENFLPATTMVQ